MTLEDETGIANAVLWVKTFEKYRRVVLSADSIQLATIGMVSLRLRAASASLAPQGRLEQSVRVTSGEEKVLAVRWRPSP